MSDRPVAAPSRDSGPLLAVLIGRSPGAARHAIRRPQVTIGRGDASDLVLDDPSVSERHALLRLSDGVWTLSDLGSVNGSWVDGEPVQRESPLASGTSLRLGGVEMVFAAHDRWEDSPPRPPRPDEPPRPGYRLSMAEPRGLPVPLLVGIGLVLLMLAGYLLARAG